MFFYGKSDIGRKRATNQDNFLNMRICDNIMLFVLCDGMGGTNGGNIASGLATRTYSDFIENTLAPYIGDDGSCDLEAVDIEGVIRDAVVAANRAVYARARESSELANMGTTLVSAVICGNEMYIANVGDSRMYMLYDDDLSQLTHDHSYVQMLVDMGQITKEEAATNPRRNILTRAVGTEKVIEVDITSMEIPDSDVYFLLCSDGLYNFVSEDLMTNIMREPLEGFDDDYDAELSQKVKTLIDRANENGGGDNITIILVRQPDANN